MKIIQEGGVTSALGYVAAGVKAGIKASGKLDMAVIYSQAPAVAAGAFTRNAVRAAPVQVSEAHLKDCKVRAVVINSGNANACTGEAGIHNARTMCEVVANGLDLATDEVAVASTGIIGVPLPMDKIIAGATAALDQLSRDGDNATQAIMTTDLTKKHIAVEVMINGHIVTIGGIAKGSGMIHPNMGTMLGFITTDVAIDPFLLQKTFLESVDESYNMVSVDGDTSTNDSAIILANGLAGNAPLVSEQDTDFETFRAALRFVNQTLAMKIAEDGEGATKLIETRVYNAKTLSDARKVAKSVIGSSLVKTAIFGGDANWGRILCAVGYSAADLLVDQIEIFVKGGDASVQIVAHGAGIAFDESLLATIFSEKKVEIEIHLHNGDQHAVAWGCDLSYDYIKINADYRT
ncbi:bifunctional glutamate N-acetyltransferase/amino-acid acetyltransferase ArgJ [Wohlfahrtiimonas chitiniclastica]|nr:bifunctional glutamate N-acetyltransferase/amino-acid acetyltransferase ArgJ [Wohlfahrtiimonas chitiniclastica]MBS7820097.1 bifunctional glutamate N-acetyltransferase/amino-acid acetyltransferase ArgJ [Wohlfahrtiimonas chitiniclastica]